METFPSQVVSPENQFWYTAPYNQVFENLPSLLYTAHITNPLKYDGTLLF